MDTDKDTLTLPLPLAIPLTQAAWSSFLMLPGARQDALCESIVALVSLGLGLGLELGVLCHRDDVL